MTPHTRKRKARERECWMGRDEAPAMAPVRPPWRLQACSVRARAMSCRRLTMRLRSTVMFCSKSSEIPNSATPNFSVSRVSIVVVTRRLVAVRSVLGELQPREHRRAPCDPKMRYFSSQVLITLVLLCPAAAQQPPQASPSSPPESPQSDFQKQQRGRSQFQQQQQQNM